MESVAGEQSLPLQQVFFPSNLLSFLEIQTLIKSHYLMPASEASNLAILIFSTCIFHF